MRREEDVHSNVGGKSVHSDAEDDISIPESVHSMGQFTYKNSANQFDL